MSLSALLADEPRRPLYRRDAEEVVLAATPATDAEVGKVIFGLLIMYESFDRRGEASKAVVIDQWRRSLTGWPVDVLEQAAQTYLDSEKASFVPQPGDVLKHCETIGRFRRALAKKARDFLDLASSSNPLS
jgi:hypothetical protein